MLAGLPGDPVILLGVVNTKLRDFYPSLEALCDDLEIDRDEKLPDGSLLSVLPHLGAR